MDMMIIRLDMLKELEQEVNKARKNLKTTQDKQESYVDLKRTCKEFVVGDHAYLKVKPKTISLKLGKCSKLAPKFYGPFQIQVRIRLVAYELALPISIKVHIVFHVSLLRKYVDDTNDVIDWNVI